MLTTHAADSASSAAGKAGFPAFIAGASALGAQIPLIVQILTGVYVLAQIFFLLRDKWWRERGNKEK